MNILPCRELLMEEGGDRTVQEPKVQTGRESGRKRNEKMRLREEGINFIIPLQLR